MPTTQPIRITRQNFLDAMLIDGVWHYWMTTAVDTEGTRVYILKYTESIRDFTRYKGVYGTPDEAVGTLAALARRSDTKVVLRSHR